jgi:hypothetical protein
MRQLAAHWRKGVRDRGGATNTNGLGPEGVRAKAVLMSKGVPSTPTPTLGYNFSKRRLTDRYDMAVGKKVKALQ